jgi:hypothetical protein
MPAMKSVGERSAGNPHAAFDERGGETDRSNDTALLLDSTCEPGTRQVPFHLPPLTLVLPIAVGPRLKSHNFSIEDQAAAPCRSRKWRMTDRHARNRYFVTSGVNLPWTHRFEFPYDVGSTCSPDPIEDAAVLWPIKAKPFGWPRKPRPALTGPARGGIRPPSDSIDS